VCPYAATFCDNEGCPAKPRVKDRDVHIDLCTYRVVPCRYTDFGCKVGECGVVGCWRVRVCVRVCCVWVMYKRSLMVRVLVYVVLQSP
jgi:hypothetical protein